ncbi:MAG: hypothetical protein HRU38_07525 [Saccharospirillaceae bacterium]|nr:hypothetical protein [Pseudomonadales bacterium]NRB78502.1 hypothetical protein [Saccharospirillaceae bacterium]
MKYKALFGSILAVSAATMSYAEETESFQKINSNNANNATLLAGSSISNINSVWFNPAIAAQNGNQASVNIIQNEAASIYFENNNQVFGVQLGRNSFSTSNNIYDLFWAKKNGDGSSMGAHVYWSTQSSSTLFQTDVDGNAIMGNSFTIETDADNSFTANIDKNKNSTFKYQTGASFGLYSEQRQLVIHAYTYDFEGDNDHFNASWTNKVAGVETEESLETQNKSTDKGSTINSSYVQVASDKLSYIGSASLSIRNNGDYSLNDSNNGTTRSVYEDSTDNRFNSIGLSAGAQYILKPNDRVEFVVQQHLSVNLNLISSTTTVEQNFSETGDTVTEGTTGVSAKTTSNSYTINAPVSLAMNMQASKKINLVASVITNAINFNSSINKTTDMSEIDDNKYVAGDVIITDDSFSVDSNTSMTVQWGGSYQFNDEFVIDFISSNNFLTDGITDGAITNQLTLTYQF